MKKIPIYAPDLTGNEKKYVLDCLDSTWISSKGEYISKFEDSFAQYIGIDYAIGVFNGTVALHLAMLTLGIGEGDEVIVPTLTYIASVNAISYVGATPVFCDSRLDTWQMDVDDVIKRITPKTKAIMAVHLYGHPCEMDRLKEICKENDIFLIEDCAEAIGSEYKSSKVGTFGDISTFSFFGNKTITCGEGGMLVTNDNTLKDRAIHLKGQGLAKHREYWHDVIGYNFRMTNIQAAIGLAQFEKIEYFINRKREIANLYNEGFKDVNIEFHQSSSNVLNTYWMCSILVLNADDRDKLRMHLSNKGIETRPLFYPIHTMPMYDKKYQKLKNAEYLGWRGINLPSYPTLTNEDVQYVINAVKSYYK